MDLKKEISVRLQQVRQHLGMTPTQLAKATGVEPQTIRDYENGKSIPGGAFLSRLVDHGIGVEWVLTGIGTITYHYIDALKSAKRIRELTHHIHTLEKGVVQPIHNLMLSDDALEAVSQTAFDTATYVAIPLYDVQAAAGVGSVVDQERIVDMLQFNEAWIRQELRASPNDLYLIYVDGESMEPTLRSGDVILLDRRATKPDREGIYILRMDGMLLVKRLQGLPGGMLKVTSDNQAYDAFTVRLAEMQDQDFAILGRVVWSGRRM